MPGKEHGSSEIQEGADIESAEALEPTEQEVEAATNEQSAMDVLAEVMEADEEENPEEQEEEEPGEAARKNLSEFAADPKMREVLFNALDLSSDGFAIDDHLDAIIERISGTGDAAQKKYQERVSEVATMSRASETVNQEDLSNVLLAMRREISSNRNQAPGSREIIRALTEVAYAEKAKTRKAKQENA